jgi:hypothetical protein
MLPCRSDVSEPTHSLSISMRCWRSCTEYDSSTEWFWSLSWQILTQEDWNVVLFNGMEKTSHWAALYFVALMTFGNYVLFNLLVAILVEGFSAEVCCSEFACLTPSLNYSEVLSSHVTHSVINNNIVTLSWSKLKSPNAILWHLCAPAVGILPGIQQGWGSKRWPFERENMTAAESSLFY